jgi:hypothetical protein
LARTADVVRCDDKLEKCRYLAIVAVDAAAPGEPRDGRAGRTVSLLIWGVSSPFCKNISVPV